MAKRKRDLEGDVAALIAAVGLPAPVREYRFVAHHVGLGPGIRKRIADAGLQDWRFDFAWPDRKLALEVEGGIWVRGRHNRPQGYQSDCVKYSWANLLGWTLLRVTAAMIDDGRALALVRTGLQTQRGE